MSIWDLAVTPKDIEDQKHNARATNRPNDVDWGTAHGKYENLGKAQLHGEIGADIGSEETDHN